MTYQYLLPDDDDRHLDEKIFTTVFVLLRAFD